MTASLDPDWVLSELRETLKQLALDPQEQRTYLDSLEVDADELALEFDAVAPVAPALVEGGYMSSAQAAAIKAVDDKLSDMSGTQNAQLWTSEALSAAPEWSEVRRLASIGLALLDGD